MARTDVLNMQRASGAALTSAATDALTGTPHRRAWDAALARLDRDYDAFADPTIIIVLALHGLHAINDAPGG